MQIAHAITELDGTFRFCEVDDAFCNLLRMSRREIFARTILDVTHEADRSQNHELLHRLVEHGIGFIIRKRYKRIDETITKVENHVSRALSSAGKARLIATVRYMGEYQINEMLRNATIRAENIAAQTEALKRMLDGKAS